jgi:hypothetical protein
MKLQIIGFLILFYLLFFFKKNINLDKSESIRPFNTTQEEDKELIFQINEIRSRSNDSTRFNEISVFFEMH